MLLIKDPTNLRAKLKYWYAEIDIGDRVTKSFWEW